MRLDAWASESQYLTHILPVWRALPEALRGILYVTTRLAKTCADIGIECVQSRPRSLLSDYPILVASYSDYRLTGRRPVIFIEHGAGQRYISEAKYASAYAGGPDRDRVVLYLCPSRIVSERNVDAYPSTVAATVGAPHLDPWHPARPKPRSDPPVVAFAWHADLRFVPEASCAFRHFAQAIPSLASDYTLLGHAHPRLYRQLKPFYDRWKIPSTPHPAQVFDEADVLVVDNSSIGPEFVSIGRSLVWLSPPWYRRDVHHGGRFWDWLALGVEVTDPADLDSGIRQSLSPVRPAEFVQGRDACLQTIYHRCDGRATERAVRAIEVFWEERWPSG